MPRTSIKRKTNPVSESGTISTGSGGSGLRGAPASEAEETLAPRRRGQDRELGFGVGTLGRVGGNYFYIGAA
jgi:hypothetical protein